MCFACIKDFVLLPGRVNTFCLTCSYLVCPTCVMRVHRDQKELLQAEQQRLIAQAAIQDHPTLAAQAPTDQAWMRAAPDDEPASGSGQSYAAVEQQPQYPLPPLLPPFFPPPPSPLPQPDFVGMAAAAACLMRSPTLLGSFSTYCWGGASQVL